MVKTLLKALLVEDDPDHARFVKSALAKAGLTSFELDHVDCLAAARDRLAVNDYDVILLDLGLPDASGFEALSEIHGLRPEISVVVLTANSEPSVGVEAADLGAQDYLYKGDLSTRTLERVVRYAIHRQQMFIELQRANELLDRRNSELQEANRLLDQKNVRMAQLCETAQQFVDNVSHEFRTPLTVIKEYVSIVRDGLAGQVTEQQGELLDVANDRADDLAIMVDDMLDVSRLEAGLLCVWRRQSRVCDIFDHVCSVLERKAAVKKVTLEISLGKDLPVVYCDPEKIGRVIINLVANAIKFCGDGGSIRLRAEPGSGQSEIMISVTDNGPGISGEDVQRIFARFQQVDGMARSSCKGFGLGLCIAKELVGLNLGTIDVESELGSGSTFSFTVPTWNPEQLAARHLDHVSQLGYHVGSVSLVVATVDAHIERTSADATDRFLQHTFPGDDLVARVLSHKWLVLAQCIQYEVDEMLDRVHTAWSEANRNMPGEKLPKIALRAEGPWLAGAEAEEALRQFRAELASTADEPGKPADPVGRRRPPAGAQIGQPSGAK